MKMQDIFKYFFLFMGAVQLVVSAFFYINTSTFLQTAVRTEGTVAEMRRSEHKRRPGESLRLTFLERPSPVDANLGPWSSVAPARLIAPRRNTRSCPTGFP